MIHSSIPAARTSSEYEKAKRSYFRRWWKMEEPGELQSMGSQRTEHDLVTEQQQQSHTSRGVLTLRRSPHLPREILTQTHSKDGERTKEGRRKTAHHPKAARTSGHPGDLRRINKAKRACSGPAGPHGAAARDIEGRAFEINIGNV